MATHAHEYYNESDSQYDNSRISIEKPEDILDPWNINPGFLPIIITHAVTFLIGIIGNSVVIITWAGRGKLRSPTAAFLVSLAAADLLLLLIYVPLETLGYFVITWDESGHICKLGSYIEMLSGMASVLNLVAVSAERFLVIVHPMKARRFCTQRKSNCGLVIVWSLAILLAAPILVTKKVHPITYYNNVTSLTAYYCWESNDNLAMAVSIYQLLSLFIIPAILMVVCYFCVIRELWASTKMVAAMTMRPSAAVTSSTSLSSISVMRVHHAGESYVVRWPEYKQHKLNNDTVNNHNNHNHHSKSIQKCRSFVEVRQTRKQVIKMLIFVIIVFLICWGPRLIMNVTIKLGLRSFTQTEYTIRIACNLLSFIHSALNPFVYGFMSSNFRRMMLNSCSSGQTSIVERETAIDDHHLIGCGNFSTFRPQKRVRRCSDMYEPSGSSKTCHTNAVHDDYGISNVKNEKIEESNGKIEYSQSN